jgi:hypothetical protein
MSNINQQIIVVAMIQVEHFWTCYCNMPIAHKFGCAMQGSLVLWWSSRSALEIIADLWHYLVALRSTGTYKQKFTALLKKNGWFFDFSTDLHTSRACFVFNKWRAFQAKYTTFDIGIKCLRVHELGDASKKCWYDKDLRGFKSRENQNSA